MHIVAVPGGGEGHEEEDRVRPGVGRGGVVDGDHPEREGHEDERRLVRPAVPGEEPHDRPDGDGEQAGEDDGQPLGAGRQREQRDGERDECPAADPEGCGDACDDARGQ
jgi:hypothetical protein